MCKSETLTISCHSRAGGNPVYARASWISAGVYPREGGGGYDKNTRISTVPKYTDLK
jgi:hypothetical protein